MSILKVENLKVNFHTYVGKVEAVRDVSFHLDKGETLVVVGESGCGKSVMAKSILQLLPKYTAKIEKDSKIYFEGKDISKLSRKKIKKIRGQDISMIFQDPMTYLNPTMKVGNQVAESLIVHEKLSRREALKKTLEILELVKIPNPEKRVFQFPHEFSGGMRQRVVIAIALACNPKILIADEPTTALDVTIQADIMELMLDIQKEFGTSIILITHDLGLAAEVADRIQVMYAGEVVETGTIKDIFENPKHPYTWALLKSIPTNDNKKGELYALQGTPPYLLHPPKACAFYDRCDYRMAICRKEHPDMIKINDQHQTRCWLEHDMAPDINFKIS